MNKTHRDDNDESLFAAACRRWGLDPNTTSYQTLASVYLGSDVDLLLAEIERRLGTAWCHLIV